MVLSRGFLGSRIMPRPVPIPAVDLPRDGTAAGPVVFPSGASIPCGLNLEAYTTQDTTNTC